MAGLGDLNRLPQSGDGSEPTYRMSMLPLGTYANSDGTESLGFALPAMIHEPLMAVERLFGTPSKPGTFGRGPDYPGNADAMRTLLLSTYGGNALNPAAAIPKGGLASGIVREAAEAAPQRMYHGTSAADDFSTFRPSESGSFGPGVYVSRDPEFAGTFAPEGTGARMLPLDVDGPLATMEQYLKTLHASGRNPEAAQRALLDQGYTGVSGDIGGSKFSDVTNVFKPGSIRSATTGETLYSDGLPSLFPAALYDDQEPQSSYASGGNVADTSGLSGLTRLPDYGFGPMTPTTIAGRPNDFVSSRDPDPTWGDLALSAAEFPARATVGQIDAAGSGIADALVDPSLANVTNAGVNTGLALMSPELTVASGLGGLGLAALRDADVIPSAEARRLRHPAPVDPVLEKVKDDPSLLALYQQIKIEQNNATRDYPGRNGDASRAAAAARVQELQGQFSAALAKRDAAKQAIYDQQVTNALAARDVELGRDRRFSDTEVGKVYDKLGGYAPLVAGFVPGVVSRLAYGPAKTLGNALLRDAEGITFGIGANNVPLAYNSFATEVDNPEQRAYAAYAYNLPDGHPDKVKAQAMADSLPKLNPVREESQEELYDPEKLKERAIMGGFEGWGGNRLGQMLTGGLGGLFRRSSYQMPPEAPLPVKTQGAPLVPLEDAAELAARNDEVLRRSSNPAGPAGERSLPVLGDVSDTVPVSPTPKQKAGRRSRSGGSKGPSKAGTVSSDNPPALPDSQSAASDELKRFLGAKQAPDLRDLKKNFSTGGRVSIDEAAKSVSATPTLGQKEAGNYKKAHVRLHGMDIAIENPRGSERFGVDKGGKRWSVTMPDHYGYIKRTEGKDGDHVDCYIGPNESSTKVFIVDQKDAHSGRFDEHKVMLGYPNRDTALSAYKRAFSDGKGADRIGDVTAMNVHQFKNWLRNGDTMKPAARQRFARGGAVKSTEPESGFLHSDVAGRTDHIPASVLAGSYVFPADFVSSLGEGNTLAGKKVLQHLMESGPDGQPMSLDAIPLHYASGGKVPIMAAGGEFIAPPHVAARWGGGDLNLAHAIFDKWVTDQRANTINDLKSLPPPQK